jgi:hypothetical protein
MAASMVRQVSGHDFSVLSRRERREQGLRSRAEKVRIRFFLAPQAVAQRSEATKGFARGCMGRTP